MSLLPALSVLSYRKEVFVLLSPGSSWRPGRHLHSCVEAQEGKFATTASLPISISASPKISWCMLAKGWEVIWGHNRLLYSHSWSWLSFCDTGVLGDALCTEEIPKAAQPSLWSARCCTKGKVHGIGWGIFSCFYSPSLCYWSIWTFARYYQKERIEAFGFPCFLTGKDRT